MANPFVFACITPHGLPVIKELAGDTPALMEATRGSMEKLGTLMEQAKPDTIVVLTPHGLRIDGQFCVINSSFMTGKMSEQTVAMMVGEQAANEGRVVQFQRSVDRDLAKAIASAAKQASLPLASANFATHEGPFSTLPLDWGIMVPLYFMPEVPIVAVSPSRQLSMAEHVRFGEVLAEAVQASNKRVGLIASCDWSHTHDATGPYGYHEDAARLDEAVVSLITSNNLEEMEMFDDRFIENAKPDGIWQTLILAGAIPRENRHPTLLSYEVPTYFGMICVAYP